VIDTKAVRELAERMDSNGRVPIPSALTCRDAARALRQCADEIDAKDAIIKQQGELIERIRMERDTLRELVREALGRNPPPGWGERAEKALEGK